jgi:gliding motility-associated-like protein
VFTIEPGPEEFVDLREDTIIRLGDSVLLDFTTDLVNWDTLIWTSSETLPPYTSDGPIWVRPLVSQNYRLQVRAGEGCFATDAVIIQVDETVNTFVPNVFSPNGDMTNDVIRPFVGPQVEEIISFTVYTRWGAEVYSLASDPGRGTENFGWDGRLNGRQMNSQVFVWEMELLLVDGTILRETGDFILMR